MKKIVFIICLVLVGCPTVNKRDEYTIKSLENLRNSAVSLKEATVKLIADKVDADTRQLIENGFDAHITELHSLSEYEKVKQDKPEIGR